MRDLDSETSQEAQMSLPLFGHPVEVPCPGDGRYMFQCFVFFNFIPGNVFLAILFFASTLEIVLLVLHSVKSRQSG